MFLLFMFLSEECFPRVGIPRNLSFGYDLPPNFHVRSGFP